jgi:thiamine biosynthesis lipoprotein
MTTNKRTGFAGRCLPRRDALRILACAGAVGAVSGLGLLGRRRARRVARRRILMGTTVNLTVLGDDVGEAEAAADTTLGCMADLEALLSRHRADSEVGRLNARGRIEGASDALLDVLRLAEHVSHLGDGAFDVTVQPVLELYRAHLDRRLGLPAPEAIEQARAPIGHRGLRVDGRTVTLDRPGARITLDGVAKGYVVDRAVDVLRASGFPNVFVEAGGDLVAGGDRGAGRPWRIGIRRPRPGLALQATFEARERAVATSGDYMQAFTEDYSQHHIIDPRTGRSSPDLASATVVAPDAATADALATLVMVLGPRAGRALLEDLPGCEGYLVSKDLEVTRTSGFETV